VIWLDDAEITDDPRCPRCGKANACKRHRWIYRGWYEGLQEGVRP